MRKSSAIFLLAAAVASLAAPVMADIIPPIGLAPGSEYQLIFLTSGTTTATSTDINSYNSFVTSQAAENGDLPSTTWTAIGSTSTVAAVNNAPNLMVDGSYLPVYDTQGNLVSDAASGGLYGGSLLSLSGADQFGNLSVGGAFTWTGSEQGGLQNPDGYVLGNQVPSNESGQIFVAVGGSAQYWLWKYERGPPPAEVPQYVEDPSYLSGYMYALSGAINVPSPEPTTITLLGSALSVLAGFRLLRRHRTA